MKIDLKDHHNLLYKKYILILRQHQSGQISRKICNLSQLLHKNLIRKASGQGVLEILINLRLCLRHLKISQDRQEMYLKDNHRTLLGCPIQIKALPILGVLR